MLAIVRQSLSHLWKQPVNQTIEVGYEVMKLTSYHTYKLDGRATSLRDLQERVYNKIWESFAYSTKHGSPSNIELYHDLGSRGCHRIESDSQLASLKPNEQTGKISLRLYINHEIVQKATQMEEL